MLKCNGLRGDGGSAATFKSVWSQVDVEVEALNCLSLLKTDGQVSSSQSAVAAFSLASLQLQLLFLEKETYCKDSICFSAI